MQRCWRDQNIEVGDHLAAAAQVGTNLGKTLHDWFTEVEQSARIEVSSKGGQVSVGIGKVEGALVDLSDGHDADVDAHTGDGPSGAGGRFISAERLEYPISVEQVHQGSTGYREPARRAS